jgi:hypothetical protein
MARNVAATIIFTAVLIIALAGVTFALATSTSVGGTTYSNDPKSCAACHNEKLYVEGYVVSQHEEANVTCMDCHQYQSPISDADCLTCHQDYDRSNKTQFPWLWVVEVRIVDAHSHTAHIPARCTTCHLQHKFELGRPIETTHSICSDCHKPYTKQP